MGEIKGDSDKKEGNSAYFPYSFVVEHLNFLESRDTKANA